MQQLQSVEEPTEPTTPPTPEPLTERRRSVFYVPLEEDIENLMSPPCGFNWSMTGVSDAELDNSDNNADFTFKSPNASNTSTINKKSNIEEVPATPKAKTKRYGLLLSASGNIDDDNSSHEGEESDECRQMQISSTSSTPIIMKSRSRNNILSFSQGSYDTPTLTPKNLKDKSKTLPSPSCGSTVTSITLPINSSASSTYFDLPFNEDISKTFPPKSSALQKTPIITSPHNNFDGDESGVSNRKYSSDTSITSTSNMISPSKKTLGFIRRAHSTKITRSNSILKNLTPNRGISEKLNITDVHHLSLDLLNNFLHNNNCGELLKNYFIKNTNDHNKYQENFSSIDENRQYDEKSFDRDGDKKNQKQETLSRFTIFFSKRSKPLKRTKSVTKLERHNKKRDSTGLRSSRSHESLLSGHSIIAGSGLVSVAPVHHSVLGRQHCFKVRDYMRVGESEKFYCCDSGQERDLWIYCLQKSIDPNLDRVRHTDDSLRLWIYEGKNLPAKKKYFCEIYLDEVLYGRTSVKLHTDLLFWGEHFDFPHIPAVSFIKVNVFREIDKKRKREKYEFIGSVQIPIQEVTSRTFSENWYGILKENSDSNANLSKSESSIKPATLRIKCRFQSIDILPISVYSDFLKYLKENYKKVCEILEPVIGVKAKEDIGQAMVLLMHAHGQAATFLTDVVVLDLLRVGDQRLTFRGNSLATKSMEAFLKLTGEQYLQDTLSKPINEIIAADKDCEVDPSKAANSLTRTQQNLINAVGMAWKSIYDSHINFPSQLRSCFATFRERLQTLDQGNMSDNLISASIFLRFLCPAILSPSLFNITNELPSTRASRNLTLVAKTLQTLANFTRFQGKENFMEFLNDFIEEEAPRMRQFLKKISIRMEPKFSNIAVENSILDWPGYIDQGKQLSILTVLLSESIEKLPEQSKNELITLKRILATINERKNHSGHDSYYMSDQENKNPLEIEKPEIKEQRKFGERETIRGVLIDNQQSNRHYDVDDAHSNSQTSLTSYNTIQHSQSQSSISLHNEADMIPTTVQNYNYSNADRSSLNSYSTDNSLPCNYDKQVNHYDNNDGIMHSCTMPRANNSSNNNKLYDENRSNLIQIGLGSGSAFTCKSPTPRTNAGIYLNYTNRPTSNSRISLPVNDLGKSETNKVLYNNSRLQGQSPGNRQGNIPMNIEDLDDLFKYAEKHSVSVSINDNKQTKENNGHLHSPTTVPTSNKINNIQRSTVTVTNKPVQSALAFKNPLYQQHQQQPASSLSSSSSSCKDHSYMAINNGKHRHQHSITPSSSEEHIPPTPTKHNERLQLYLNNFKEKNNEDPIRLHPVTHRTISGNSTSSGASYNSTHLQPNMRHYKLDINVPVGEGDYQNVDRTKSNSGGVLNVANHFQRRFSVESTKNFSDSSTDTEALLSSDDKRQRPPLRQSESYEIQRLQVSLDNLRYKLDQDAAELKTTHDSLVDCNRNGNTVSGKNAASDTQMRGIIERLITMEEDLRREQLKMSLALTYKQRVIEAQGQQIAALDAANNRLLGALKELRQRYENQQQHDQNKQF